MADGQTNRPQSSTSNDTREKYSLKQNKASREDTDDATLAPGLDGVQGLNEDATKEEEERGETTRVTRLVYDEYDPS